MGHAFGAQPRHHPHPHVGRVEAEADRRAASPGIGVGMRGVVLWAQHGTALESGAIYRRPRFRCAGKSTEGERKLARRSLGSRHPTALSTQRRHCGRVA
jgi:hypothetical protein